MLVCIFEHVQWRWPSNDSTDLVAQWTQLLAWKPLLLLTPGVLGGVWLTFMVRRRGAPSQRMAAPALCSYDRMYL